MQSTVPKVMLVQATRADAFDLARLRCASLVEMGLLSHAKRATFERVAAAEIFQLFAQEQLIAWLLIEAGVPRGCACAIFWERLPYQQGSLHAEIAGVYVEPALRRNGYATELVREVLQGASARGVRKITLSPTEVGRSIYKRLGFRRREQMEYVP
jgi:GNAT superfamily N-acetyltransferase